MLPCDGFDKVEQNKGGLVEPKTTFFTGNLEKKKFVEMGTQTDEPQAKPKASVSTQAMPKAG